MWRGRRVDGGHKTAGAPPLATRRETIAPGRRGRTAELRADLSTGGHEKKPPRKKVQSSGVMATGGAVARSSRHAAPERASHVTSSSTGPRATNGASGAATHTLRQ